MKFSDVTKVTLYRGSKTHIRLVNYTSSTLLCLQPSSSLWLFLGSPAHGRGNQEQDTDSRTHSFRWHYPGHREAGGVYICKSIVNYLRHGNFICKYPAYRRIPGGVYICKSIVNDLRHGNYICKIIGGPSPLGTGQGHSSTENTPTKLMRMLPLTGMNIPTQVMRITPLN